jgi:hypothetical protein
MLCHLSFSFMAPVFAILHTLGALPPSAITFSAFAQQRRFCRAHGGTFSARLLLMIYH